jgi:hypothetical protein
MEHAMIEATETISHFDLDAYSYGDAEGNLHAAKRLFIAASNCAEPVEDGGTPALEIGEAISSLMMEIEENLKPYSPGWRRDLRLCRLMAEAMVAAVADEFCPEVVKAIAEAGKKAAAELADETFPKDA